MHQISKKLLAAAVLFFATASATPTPVDAAPPSSPSCGDSGLANMAPVPVDAAKELNGLLDARGDNPAFDNCATKDDGSLNAIATTADGKYSVILETETLTGTLPPGSTKKAMGCARAANYLEGLIGGCNSINGFTGGIAGCQEVVETPGLGICVGLH